MAIMPLLKTKGLLATAIAWAAFCMPISMMRVRCSFWFRRMDLDSKTPPPHCKQNEHRDAQSQFTELGHDSGVMLYEENRSQQD